MLHKIYFVVPTIPSELHQILNSGHPLPCPEVLAPVRPPLRGAQWSWIIQTFLYMKKAGLNVELVDELVDNAICVVHYSTFKNRPLGVNSFIVGIRADNPPLRMREIEIVQSPANLGKDDAFLMSHWPQPRLIPRNEERGNQLTKISYFGGEGSISSQYYSPQIRSALDKMGITLNLCFGSIHWSDYSDTDVVLAVRDHHHPVLINTKPASKLVNAWHAGCVALLGNEPAFRSIGNSGSDYFEVSSPVDMLQTITLLKRSPETYRRVRKAGQLKYSQFDFDAVQSNWIALFSGPIAKAYLEWKSNRSSYARRTYRYSQLVHQWIDHKLFKIPVYATLFVNDWKDKHLS